MGFFCVDLINRALLSLLTLLPESLSYPFQFAFMQRALLTSIFVGLTCGLFSCFVVLKGWALLGDAISHAVLPGVALSYVFGLPHLVGAFFSGVSAAFAMGLLERKSPLKHDTAMGIMLTFYFALGIVLMSRLKTATYVMHILFGNVLGVSLESLILTFYVCLVSLVAIYVFFPELRLFLFDPAHARTLGLHTTYQHCGLVFFLTLVMVISLETVGIILVVALLITPGASSYLLTKSLTSMVIVSGFFGVFSTVVGLYCSFLFNVPSGGTIVLIATALFFLCLVFSPKTGVRKKLRNLPERRGTL